MGTEVVVIQDTSGSMSRLLRTSEKSIKMIIDDQLKMGDANFTLVTFESRVRTVKDRIPLSTINGISGRMFA